MSSIVVATANNVERHQPKLALVSSVGAARVRNCTKIVQRRPVSLPPIYYPKIGVKFLPLCTGLGNNHKTLRKAKL